MEDLELKKIKEIFLEEIKKIKNLKEVQDLKVKYLGRKGELTKILRELKELSAEEKFKLGRLANELKKELVVYLDEVKDRLEKTIKSSGELDLTLPGQKFELGHLHPNSRVQYQLEDIFSSMGFMVLDGPELESEFYNFEGLNIPATHPARDIQDTFFIDEEKGFNPNNRLLMRTHTSNLQVRAMKEYGVPLRVIIPGRCFRYEATDASHENTFYHLEGLMIDKEISIAHLIVVMKELLSQIFKKEIKIRLRPGYFPFVEPGFELDINCLICSGQGCSVCKNSGWVEILPCGLVHPNVLRAGGVDPEEYSGFAFGLGLTRLVMMKYNIDDIRLLQSGDLRFLEQF